MTEHTTAGMAPPPLPGFEGYIFHQRRSVALSLTSHHFLLLVTQVLVYVLCMMIKLRHQLEIAVYSGIEHARVSLFRLLGQDKSPLTSVCFS